MEKNKLPPQIKHAYMIVWKTVVYLEICGIELVIIKSYLIKYVTPLNFVLYVFYYIMYLWTSDSSDS